MFTIQDCSEILNRLQNEQSQLQGKIEVLSNQIQEAELKLEEHKDTTEIYKQSVEVLDIAQEAVRETVQKGFETIVTNALQTVFGQGYALKLNYSRRGNLQQVDFVIQRPDLKEAYDPMDTSGGGAIDIVAIALRSVILELFQSKNKSPIILDECFKHLSKGHLQQAGEFLNALSKKLNRQIILVTHKQELVEVATNAIEIKKEIILK